MVTGGGLSLDGQQWQACKPSYFIAKRVLAEVFRGKLLKKLQRALEKGELHFDLADGKRHLRRAARKRWVVDVRPPFAGPEVFLKYISRYVHRVAIDDRRIVDYDGRHVTFQYRDRRRGCVQPRFYPASKPPLRACAPSDDAG
ncbi:transposase [Planctomycetota bacterium]